MENIEKAALLMQAGRVHAPAAGAHSTFTCSAGMAVCRCGKSVVRQETHPRTLGCGVQAPCGSCWSCRDRPSCPRSALSCQNQRITLCTACFLQTFTAELTFVPAAVFSLHHAPLPSDDKQTSVKYTCACACMQDMQWAIRMLLPRPAGMPAPAIPATAAATVAGLGVGPGADGNGGPAAALALLAEHAQQAQVRPHKRNSSLIPFLPSLMIANVMQHHCTCPLIAVLLCFCGQLLSCAAGVTPYGV